MEGTKAESRRRRGSIVESHATLAKKKILVRWDGSIVYDIFPRVSIKFVDAYT